MMSLSTLIHSLHKFPLSWRTPTPVHQGKVQCNDYRFSVSLILGACGASSGAATTGGLVARGEGTWSEVLWPKPRELLRLGVKGGGVPADPDADAAVDLGVAAGSCTPVLNSAQRGHLRFVSERGIMWCESENARTAGQVNGGWRTHMTHLSAVAAASLDK
jgi:hypothetical protein